MLSKKFNLRSITFFIQVFKNRNFNFFFIGGSLTQIAGQFYGIALPWLVLQTTNSSTALGFVMALAGLTRAAFMLLGGVISDRISSKMVMVWTGLFRFFIIITPAFLLFTNRTELWIIYIIALFLGFMDAFAYPAETAIIPDLVEKKDLGPANALAQIIVYIFQILGPVAAGWIIALFNKMMPETRSIGWIFVMGAVGFIISSLFFYLIKPKVIPVVAETRKKSVMTLIKEMLIYMWKDPILRLVFLLALGINFFMLGPMTIGIPVLAKWSLANNVNAYGIIMAVWGAGSLLGAILGGGLPKPKAKRFGTTLLAVVAFAGASVAVLGFCHSVLTMSLAAGLVGLTNGYILVLFLVWLQIRTPENLMGRVVSLMSFAWIGLYPVSSALCGYLLKLSPSLTLLGSGVLLIILTGAVALMPSFRKIGFVLEKESNHVS